MESFWNEVQSNDSTDAEHMEFPEDIEVTVLERLESRILEMVEQLRESRRRQMAAEQQVEQLKAELAEKDRRLQEALSQQGSWDADRKAVRSKIESLLDRIESMEQ